jgi:hypothetical protein
LRWTATFVSPIKSTCIGSSNKCRFGIAARSTRWGRSAHFSSCGNVSSVPVFKATAKPGEFLEARFHNRSSLRAVSVGRPFPISNPNWPYEEPDAGKFRPNWAGERSHRHVSLVPAWANCGHAWGDSCVGKSEAAATFFLARHAIGDWVELEPTDVAENKYSLIHGFRLLSIYQTDAGEKLWIIAEAEEMFSPSRPIDRV